jgi:polynucleotide 5'-hydroxyl-kinase GRC3/NOL9
MALPFREELLVSLTLRGRFYYDRRNLNRIEAQRWQQGGILQKRSIVVPPEWEQAARMPLEGPIMIVGACDTGKSTFAHWLFEKMSRLTPGPIAFLDGDPGQSTLGPPTTITLAAARRATRFPGRGRRWRIFVGSTSPRNHSPQLMAGVARLAEISSRTGCRAIICDTTGLIDPAQGGVALKLAKIALLNPEVLFAFQRRDELEPLLAPLRKRSRPGIVELDVSPAVRPRAKEARWQNRACRYAQYFSGAGIIKLDLEWFAVLPEPFLHPSQLLAFENAAGLLLALGIVMSQSGHHAQVLSPLRNPSRIDAIRLADLTVDPVTFADSTLNLSAAHLRFKAK